MENKLSLDELEAIISASRDREKRNQEFFAAIQGIDLNEGQANTDFEAVKRRAEAKLNGVDEEEYELDMAGIDFETD